MQSEAGEDQQQALSITRPSSVQSTTIKPLWFLYAAISLVDVLFPSFSCSYLLGVVQ